MSDFTHAFWPLFVSGVTLVSIGPLTSSAPSALKRAMRRGP